MKQQIKRALTKSASQILDYYYYHLFEKREKRIALKNGIPFKTTLEEDAWCDFWRSLVKFNNRYAFRLYSAYSGNNCNVICEPAAIAINKALNPPRYRGYYSDKNMFNHILPSEFMPKTIFRRMNGVLMDSAYNIISQKDKMSMNTLFQECLTDKVIMKPTTDTSSGLGVTLFEKNINGDFICKKNGHKLNMIYIDNVCSDFIVQEAIEQHPFMAQFNESSVNTIRIATYRSIVDDQIHILSSVIRMGVKGSVADNLHMGGRMVGVDEGGVLADYCIDADGVRYDSHNSINFKESKFQIPDYENVKSFAKQVAKKLNCCRLVQHDICIDSKGNPMLIEYNISSFSAWIAQFTGKPAFGDFAREMRDYALSKNIPH